MYLAIYGTSNYIASSIIAIVMYEYIDHWVLVLLLATNQY